MWGIKGPMPSYEIYEMFYKTPQKFGKSPFYAFIGYLANILQKQNPQACHKNVLGEIRKFFVANLGMRGWHCDALCDILTRWAS